MDQSQQNFILLLVLLLGGMVVAGLGATAYAGLARRVGALEKDYRDLHAAIQEIRLALGPLAKSHELAEMRRELIGEMRPLIAEVAVQVAGQILASETTPRGRVKREVRDAAARASGQPVVNMRGANIGGNVDLGNVAGGSQGGSQTGVPAEGLRWGVDPPPKE